jgi:hypothetical protein
MRVARWSSVLYMKESDLGLMAMPGDELNLKELTRALLMGASMTTLPTIFAGCSASSSDQLEQLSNTITVQYLCRDALESANVEKVETILTTFPASRCIPSLLDAMPPEILTRISPEALGGLPANIRRQISPNVASQLRFPSAPAAIYDRKFAEERLSRTRGEHSGNNRQAS